MDIMSSSFAAINDISLQFYTFSKKARKGLNGDIKPTAYNTGFAAHFVRPNASHFAKPEHVI